MQPYYFLQNSYALFHMTVSLIPPDRPNVAMACYDTHALLWTGRHIALAHVDALLWHRCIVLADILIQYMKTHCYGTCRHIVIAHTGTQRNIDMTHRHLTVVHTDTLPWHTDIVLACTDTHITVAHRHCWCTHMTVAHTDIAIVHTDTFQWHTDTLLCHTDTN